MRSVARVGSPRSTMRSSCSPRGDGARDRRAAAPLVLVGAADSYLDLGLLYALDAEGRLKTGEVADGFVPGEGAAFLLLGPAGAAARSGRQPIARIAGVGRAHEAGHLYSAEPCRGDGLAAAFSALFERTGSDGQRRRRLRLRRAQR